jgi:hypothetical protein
LAQTLNPSADAGIASRPASKVSRNLSIYI